MVEVRNLFAKFFKIKCDNRIFWYFELFVISNVLRKVRVKTTKILLYCDNEVLVLYLLLLIQEYFAINFQWNQFPDQNFLSIWMFYGYLVLFFQNKDQKRGRLGIAIAKTLWLHRKLYSSYHQSLSHRSSPKIIGTELLLMPMKSLEFCPIPEAPGFHLKGDNTIS